jgi:hypothetical protein
VIPSQLALVAALAVVWLPMSAAAVSVSTEAAATWAENLSRSTTPSDRQEAALYSARAETQWRYAPAAYHTLLASFALEAKTCPKFDGLDAIVLSPRADWQRKIGLGLSAPVARIGLGTDLERARDAARRGWSGVLSASIAQRWNESWRGALSAEWTRHDRRDPVYDRQKRVLAAHLDWDLTTRWRLSAGASRGWGEEAVNASWASWARALYGGAGPVVAAYYSSLRWTSSPVFGPGWVAYRIDATTDVWWTALTPALSERTALPIRFEIAEVRGKVTSYRSSFLSVGLLHRF